MEQWSGNVALVTGAAGGIGSAITESLVKSGMKVVGCDVNLDVLKAMSEKLKSEKGELHIMKCDLKKEDEILTMFEEIKQKYGGVDVCVNSAGVVNFASNLNGETAKWKDVLDVNVLALSICTREAIKSMKERNNVGHIIHISSVAAHCNIPQTNLCMYLASKSAIKSLTESLRVELRQEKSNIRISSISPSSVDTNLLKKGVSEELYKELKEDEGTVLLPEDIASTVVYILSCPPRVQVHDVIIRGVNSEA